MNYICRACDQGMYSDFIDVPSHNPDWVNADYEDGVGNDGQPRCVFIYYRKL